jgi:hypothetical protein
MSQIRNNAGALRQRFSPRPGNSSLWDSSDLTPFHDLPWWRNNSLAHM